MESSYCLSQNRGNEVGWVVCSSWEPGFLRDLCEHFVSFAVKKLLTAKCAKHRELPEENL